MRDRRRGSSLRWKFGAFVRPKIGAVPGEAPLPTLLLQDVRLYWGFMNRDDHREEWGEWADLPGCGCKR